MYKDLKNQLKSIRDIKLLVNNLDSLEEIKQLEKYLSENGFIKYSKYVMYRIKKYKVK